MVNPAAGGGRCGRLAGAALERLRHGGIAYDVRETQAAGDATRIAREAYTTGFRDFIAVGGDGTTYEVVTGLFPAANEAGRASLGVLPLGTGNSFLRDFTTNHATEHAIQALLARRSRRCDVVQLEHASGMLHYINLLSMGFIADVCTLTNRRFKRFGMAGYGLGVFGALASLRSQVFPWRDGGEALETAETTPISFISFCNSRFTGGSMLMAPAADTGDGWLDVVQVGHLSRWELVRAFPSVFRGEHIGHPAVTTRRVRSVDFSLSHAIDLMIDGEVVKAQPRRMQVLPRALDVWV